MHRAEVCVGRVPTIHADVGVGECGAYNTRRCSVGSVRGLLI